MIEFLERISTGYDKAARQARIGFATALFAGLTALVSTPALAQEITPDLQEPAALSKPSVVGGRNVRLGEWRRQFRWIVTMVPFGQRNTLACGGTLIAPQWVLTAAHCLEGVLPFDIQIRIRAQTLSERGQIVNVEQIISHPNFNSSTFDSDVALIKLVRPLTLMPLANFASLADTRRYATRGKFARVLGWGATSEGGRGSDTLKIASVPIQTNNYCNTAYRGGITQNMICAAPRSGGRDGCQGDSGGPLVVKDGAGEWTQVGITSFGRGCARPNTPGVYTRVGRFKPWIDQTIASRSACNISGLSLPIRTPNSLDCASLAARGDSAVAAARIGFPINFGGTSYTTVYVNTNGSLTFEKSGSTGTPGALEDQDVPMIAPFLADTAAQTAIHQIVSYGQATIDGKRAFIAIWQTDGDDDESQDARRTFQVALIETRRGSGDFKLEFNYDQIQAGSSDASGGANALDGVSAKVGWSAPGPQANSHALRGSGVSGALVDGGARALSENGNAAKKGRYSYTFTDGIGRGR